MLTKTILSTISLESESGNCECGICATCELVVMPAETPLTTLQSDILEAEFAHTASTDDVTRLEVAAAALEALCVPLTTDTPLPPTDATALYSAVHEITIAMPTVEHYALPALECFVTHPTEALTIALESIGEFIIRIWEAIKAALAQIFSAILKFLKNLLGYNGAMERQSNANRARILRLTHRFDHGQYPPTAPTYPTPPVTGGTVVEPVVAPVVPITAVVLSESSIEALWLTDRRCVSTTIIKDIERYRNMFVNCFLKFTDNQLKGDKVSRRILKGAIEMAARLVVGGPNKDAAIAQALITYTKEQTATAAATLGKERHRLFAGFGGVYLGGITIAAKTDGDRFVWPDYDTATEVSIPVMSVKELNTLQSSATTLSIAYASYISGTYNELEEAFDETNGRLSREIERLSKDLGNFPRTIDAFKEAFNTNKATTDNLVGNLYRVTLKTSRLCAALHGQIIPDMIAALESQTV